MHSIQVLLTRLWLVMFSSSLDSSYDSLFGWFAGHFFVDSKGQRIAQVRCKEFDGSGCIRRRKKMYETRVGPFYLGNKRACKRIARNIAPEYSIVIA